MSRLELPAPIQGLNRNWRLSNQPPETSNDLLNVRSKEGLGKRVMLSTRPGLSRYTPGFIGGQGNKVQAIVSVAHQQRHVSYSAPTLPNEVWASSFTATNAANIVEPGLFDDFWTIENGNVVHRYNRYGIEISTITIPKPNSSSVLGTLCIADDGGSAFVGTSAPDGGNAFIWKIAIAADNVTLSIAWQATTVAATGAYIGRMHEANGALYTLESNPGASGGATTYGSVSLVRYTNLDADGPTVSGTRTALATVNATNIGAPWLGTDSVYAHDMAMRTTGVTEWACAVGTQIGVATGRWAVFKVKADFTVPAAYIVTNDESGGLTANNVGGVGLGVAMDVTGSVFSLGKRNTNDNVWFRKIIDTGGALQVSGGGAWVRTTVQDLGGAGNNPQFAFPRIGVDPFGNSAAPTCRNTSGVVQARIFTAAGAVYSSIQQQAFVSSVPTNISNEIHACAFATTYPNYLVDDFKIADLLAVAGTAVATLLTPTNLTSSVWGYDILQETQLSVSSRRNTNLAVIAGNVYKFDSSSSASPTNNTARGVPFSATARFVQMATMAGEVFITDGLSYAVCRPAPTIANPNGIIVDWNANGLGKIPPQGRLICRWRNRIVIAHTADSPYAWAMSAFNDPYDWDYFPPVVLETQAVSGAALDAAGNQPQIIHAMIPWSDDLMFFLCERCIIRLDGDPMAGGRMSVVTDEVGGAFGTPWCKDPEGRMYFFGARGGVYQMSPTGQILWMTQANIEDDLTEIDLTQNYVTLHWNQRDNGLHVLQMPFGAGGTHLKHYFWSQQTNGWFQDEFGSTANTTMQPTAAAVLDGDTPGERVFVTGTEDGRLLRWDPLSTSDDGAPIESRALFGPLMGASSEKQMRFKRPAVVMASDRGGAYVKFFASDTPTIGQLPNEEFYVGPGVNHRLPIGGRGNFVWMQIRSSSRVTAGTPGHSEMWAVESVNVDVYPAGRKQVRS